MTNLELLKIAQEEEDKAYNTFCEVRKICGEDELLTLTYAHNWIGKRELVRRLTDVLCADV